MRRCGGGGLLHLVGGEGGRRRQGKEHDVKGEDCQDLAAPDAPTVPNQGTQPQYAVDLISAARGTIPKPTTPRPRPARGRNGKIAFRIIWPELARDPSRRSRPTRRACTHPHGRPWGYPRPPWPVSWGSIDTFERPAKGLASDPGYGPHGVPSRGPPAQFGRKRGADLFYLWLHR